MEFKRSYEISLWTLQDEFITVLKPINVRNVGQLESKDLQLNASDGINQYSCSIPMYVYDGAIRKENPIWHNTINGDIIANMRKLKIILNKNTDVEEIYEFLINKVEERHENDQLYCDITCEDLAYNELGKIGYKVSLSSEVFEEEHRLWEENKFNSEQTEEEPLQNLQYWLNKTEFFGGELDNPESIIDTDTSKWYYSIMMDWSSYAQLPNNARDIHKVYEEAYVTSWATIDNELVPAGIQNYREKARSIDEQESNIYNITQTLAEKFEIFVKYRYLYDDNYHIIGRRVIFYNNFLREQDGYLDITYPYNTSSIKREIDGTSISTKMFVRPVDDENTEAGIASIIDVPTNKSGEDYLLNFEYMLQIGAITKEQYQEIPRFERKMREFNIALKDLANALDNKTVDSNKLNAQITLYNNAIINDQKSLNNANDLLNDLDQKDYDIDGYITIDAGNRKTAILIPMEEANYYSISISEQGVVPSTLEVWLKYDFTTNELSEHINGLFVYDEFGGLVGLNNIYIENKGPQSMVYLTYKYSPKLKYEQVTKIWTERLFKDQKDLEDVIIQYNDLIQEIDELKVEYDNLLEEKRAAVRSFENMMGPALRESYWQPDDYKAFGDAYENTFSYTLGANINTITSTSQNSTFFWDDQVFDGEQKSYYEMTILQSPSYYPCIKIPQNKYQTIIDNWDKKINFVFYDFIAGALEDDRYVDKNLRYFTIGSEAQLVFVQEGNGIIPAIMLTNMQTVSAYTIRNMIVPRAEANSPSIGIVTVEEIEDPDPDEPKLDVVFEKLFDVEWINLNNLQNINGTVKDVTDENNYNDWLDYLLSLSQNNSALAAAKAEGLLWNEVTIYYPRIDIPSMLLKNDENITIHCGENLLEKYKDYYILSRTDEYDVSLSTEHYESHYFITIKPENILLNLLNGADVKLDIFYLLSNASTVIYLDAIQVLKENAMPKVTYTIDPTVLDTKMHYILYKQLNRIANINDTDLRFENVQGYISGLTLNLDNPFEDKIEIKNYKNKFEDLFSSIVAQTEAMKKSEYTIGLASTAFIGSGKLAPEIVQNSLNDIDLQYSFNQGRLTIDEENGIWAINDDGVVAMRGGGIFTATTKNPDGTWDWNTGILPQGINADLITTGQLDTNLIRIYAGDKLRFQMNGDGLYAYKSIYDDPTIVNLIKAAGNNVPQEIIDEIEARSGLDLKQYVVHDENGLFLTAKEGAIVPDTNTDAKVKRLEQDVDRVEVSWNGLKLRNWNGNETLAADPDTGDLTITGKLNATGLNIGETSDNPNDIIVTGGKLKFSGSSGVDIVSGGNINISTGGTFTTNTQNFNIDNKGNVEITGVLNATGLNIGEDAIGSFRGAVLDTPGVQETINIVTDSEEVLQKMTFDSENGLIVKANNNSPYSTATKNDGFYVKYNDTDVAKFTGTATEVQSLRIGQIVVRPTARGGWVWVDE